jgi:hypothetical protein
MKFVRSASILVLALSITACAGLPGPSSVRIGETQGDVAARLGKPAAERTLPSGGTAWYYPTGPSGFFTYRAIFGSGGTVTEYDQVLTRERLQALPEGATENAVLDALGPPMQRMTFARTDTEVWSYRWLEGTFEMIAEATFNTRKGGLMQVTTFRDPAFTESVGPL